MTKTEVLNSHSIASVLGCSTRRTRLYHKQDLNPTFQSGLKTGPIKIGRVDLRKIKKGKK